MNKNNIAEHEQVIYHSKEKLITSYKKNPSKIIDELVASISSFLSCELDVLMYHKYKRNFETDCRKALGNIFFALFEKEASFLIFPDTIPGFTTMIYKKNKKYFFNTENKKLLTAPSKEAINFTGKTINNLFNNFFNQNNQLVLLVESEEIMMMFCPVSDLDKYLKELEVYSLSN